MTDVISVSDAISVVEDESEIGVWVPDASELFETKSSKRSDWLPPKLLKEIIYNIIIDMMNIYHKKFGRERDI